MAHPQDDERASGSSETDLARSQKLELLHAARRTLEVFLDSAHRLVLESEDPALLVAAGAFVSLHRHAPRPGETRLRGCIGTFESSEPLLDTVCRMAISAATHDPRFLPVTREELPGLHIEISVLSPRRAVAAEEVEVGRHGVFITSAGHRGVLLPQVATEHGWDRETFLEHTCVKAGLPADAWRDAETLVEVFSAQVFGEQS